MHISAPRSNRDVRNVNTAPTDATPDPLSDVENQPISSPRKADVYPTGMDAPRPTLGRPSSTGPTPEETISKNARSFFAAYTNGNPAGMRAQLAPGTVYQDPVFPHLEGQDQVGRMWKMVAGGGTVHADVQNVVADPQGADVTWIAKYKFLGANIENHIQTRLDFDDDGRITRQVDTFDWRAWGNQTPFPVRYLLRTSVGQRLVQWALGRRLK